MKNLKDQKVKNWQFDESRKTVKSKYWFSDGSTETNYFDDNYNKKTLYTFKKEKKNVRKK